MSFLSSAVLNIASGLIVFLMATTGAVRSDFVRLFLIVYAVTFVVLLVVPDGGQVNAALALGLVMHAILNSTSVDADKRTSEHIESKQKTMIISGVINAHSGSDQSFTTYDKTSENYRALPKSVNRFGGAQFSVSWWMLFKGAISDSQVRGKTLFLRGDKKKYSPKFRPHGESVEKPYFTAAPAPDYKDHVVACPKIAFPSGEKCANKLVVSVNTDRKLVQEFHIGTDAMELDMQKNALSLLPNSWVMLTFVFEDAYDLSNFEKGIRMRFFLNDTLYSEQTAPGSLRLNSGPVHVLPGETKETAGIVDAFLSDIKHFNWALTPKEVSALHRLGFNDDRADDAVTAARKLHLNPRNDIDISNLTADIYRTRAANRIIPIVPVEAVATTSTIAPAGAT